VGGSDYGTSGIAQAGIALGDDPPIDTEDDHLLRQTVILICPDKFPIDTTEPFDVCDDRTGDFPNSEGSNGLASRFERNPGGGLVETINITRFVCAIVIRDSKEVRPQPAVAVVGTAALGVDTAQFPERAFLRVDVQIADFRDTETFAETAKKWLMAWLAVQRGIDVAEGFVFVITPLQFSKQGAAGKPLRFQGGA